MTATGSKRIAFAADLTDAIARRARDTTVREVRTDRVELDGETRQLIADLRARVEELESHAGAQIEFSNALALCLDMARESEARTKLLEKEARETRRVVEIVAPALAAIGRR